MLKKNIEFEDFAGEKRTYEAHFHMTKAEVIRWLMTTGDYTLDKVLERIAKERNGKQILETFEDLIHRSYGVISLDNVQFVKNEEEWKKFYESNAYSELLVEIVTDGRKAAEFVNGIVPKDLADEIAKTMKENPNGIPDALKEYSEVFTAGQQAVTGSPQAKISGSISQADVVPMRPGV